MVQITIRRGPAGSATVSVEFGGIGTDESIPCSVSERALRIACRVSPGTILSLHADRLGSITLDSVARLNDDTGEYEDVQTRDALANYAFLFDVMEPQRK